jgi:uncharacterized protein YndB with AHSA1/START domain
MATPEPTAVSPAEIVHGSLSLHRAFGAPPSRVFGAFSTLEQRTRWFRIPGTTDHQLDIRVGGGETITASTAVAGHTEDIYYRSQFIEIAPERIVYRYQSRVDHRIHVAASVVVDLTADGSGTALTYTDEYALYVYPKSAIAPQWSLTTRARYA